MYKNYTKKIWLIMRLTTVILIATLMQVSAAGFAQRITLNEHGAQLKNVLQKIRAQSGYGFLFDRKVITKINPVNISLHNVSLEEAMNNVLIGLPLTYTIDGKTILIKLKEESVLDNLAHYFASITVTGKVIDENGLPLQGASAKIKGTNKYTMTNQQGVFVLTNVDENAVIVVSFVGYEPIELKAKSSLGVVSLKLINSKLDEVMVIGYGTTTKRLSTGSSVQVKAAELDQQPISNPILGLQGRVAGAFISQTAGYSGAQFNIQIRGQNSISALNINNGAPLYIVDGIPFNSTPVEQTSGAFGAYALSPLNTLNPTEIETIDILKDADATAIYGSRGANGVVLITTKKGKAGNTKVNIDLSSGIGEATNTVKLLDIDQYLSLRRQAFANDGINPATITNPPLDLTLWDQHTNTDFTKLVLGNTQHQTRATFDISGGDQNTQFLFGGNYRHESSILPTNTADNVVQFHLNTQHHSRDNKFGALISVSYSVDNNAIPNINVSSGQYGLPPNYPIYTSSGGYNWAGGYGNPLAPFIGTFSLKSTNMITNASLHYMVIPGLDLKVNAGYNHDNVVNNTITPVIAVNPAFNPTPSIVTGNNYIKTYIVEPQATYTHTWGKGKLKAIVGATWQESQFVQPYYLIGSYTNIQLVNNLGTTTVLAKISGYKDYKYDSGFGRVEYDWDGKYLFSGNIRRDGSSRFGDYRAFGNFGSLALGWIFSKENFVKDNLPWLSFGKLRTSYGSVGSDKTLQDYSYLSTYSSAAFPYGTIAGLAPTNIANPYLQWEETNKLDIALDLGFLHDRIFFSADVYRNRTNHLLATQPLPPHDGFGSFAANLPDGAIVQNQGLELELSTVNIKNKNFSWNTSVNFTLPQNKLLAFPDLANNPSYVNSYVVGQSLNTRFLYHSTGFVDGIPTVQDVNGDGVITSGYSATGKSDFIVAGNSDPKFYGGIDNTISYKGITLNFLFQFVKRTAQRGDLLGYPGTANNIAQSVLDLPFKYSATSGATYPTNFYSRYTQSDAAIEDASFLRLKNVSLSYNVPQMWVKKIKMSALQVYIHGQNLLTFTPYKGYDPETLSGIAVPTLRMIVAGIKTTF